MRYFSILFFAAIAACQSAEKKPAAADAGWQMGPFTKQDAVNPVLTPGKLRFNDPILHQSVGWEEQFVYNPAAVVKDGKVYLLYRAEDSIGKHAGTSRIGLAESSDGLHFTRRAEPVLYPDKDSLQQYEWEGGCEDPRIAEDENGTYFLTYTAYDGTTARLFVASSKDLIHWQKHGSVFKQVRGGTFVNNWSKAGAILCRQKGDKMIAARVNGKYWMYWGESNIYAASSDDLINWMPVEETDPVKVTYDSLRKYKAFKPVFSPRPGKFDSYLVEPGPLAILTDKGIVFLYNSRNDPDKGDKTLAPGTYAAGQVLIDPKDPTRVIDRSEKWFITPDKPYEITGNVNNVCFIEGLVYFQNRWFLYYGTADSKIAVATAN